MRKIYYLIATSLFLFACAPYVETRSLRGEYYEGRAEIRRERAEMYRDIMQSDSRWEARQAYRQGMREIRRERREMRREMRREYWRQRF